MYNGDAGKENKINNKYQIYWKEGFLMPKTKKAAAAAEKEETKVTKAAEKETRAAEKVAEKAAEKVAEKAVEKVEEKKAVAKKAPAKKAPAKKTAPNKPAEAKVNFFVEFGGVQVSVEKVVADVKATYGKDAKEVAVYLKPEESKAYFVADGESGEMDVFFC